MEIHSVWFGVTKRLLTGPGDFYERLTGQDGYGVSLKFAAVSSSLVALQVAVVFLLVGLDEPLYGLGLGAAFAVLAFVFTYLVYLTEALTAHAILYLMGVRGLPRTMEAFAYATSVRTTFLLIPLVNLVFGLYGLHLQYVGVKTLHGDSTKAAVAVLLGVALSMIPFLVALVLLAAVVGSFVLGIGSAV